MSGTEVWNKSRTEHWVSAAWAEGACKALALSNPEAGVLALEACMPREDGLPAWVDPVWVVFPCDVAAASLVAVGCPGDVLNRLGALAIGRSEDAEGLAAQAYRELISRATASIGAALRSRTGAELHFDGAVDVEETPDVSLAVEFRFEVDGENCSIVLAPNEAFLEAVGGGAVDDSASDKTRAEPPSAVENPHRNLEMLLDLEMEVAVSFGQTEMRLKDVLKLAVGSIVELRRQASDPVEVLVNDTVIARGEVVVVDSNYGVRITDVSSRRERIQSIF